VAFFLSLATEPVTQDIAMGGLKMMITGDGRELGRNGYPGWVVRAEGRGSNLPGVGR
jgi:hypothetical protein